MLEQGTQEWREKLWPPRINRQHYAPHMADKPQMLIWREVNGGYRFVVDREVKR